MFGDKTLGRHKTQCEVDELFEFSRLKNYEHTGEFIEYLARKLNTDLRQVPLLLTTQNNHHTEDLKQLTHLVFEAKESPAMFFVRKGVSVLFANGKTNGINLESSHSQTHIVPVHDGHSLQKLRKTLRIGGQIVDEYISDLIKKQRKDNHLIAPFKLFPSQLSPDAESKKTQFLSEPVTESFRRLLERRLVRNFKPILNRLKQNKQGE